MEIAELTTSVGFSEAANMLSYHLDTLEDVCEKIVPYLTKQPVIAELSRENKNEGNLFEEARQTLDNCFDEAIKLHDLLKIDAAKDLYDSL